MERKVLSSQLFVPLLVVLPALLLLGCVVINRRPRPRPSPRPCNAPGVLGALQGLPDCPAPSPSPSSSPTPEPSPFPTPLALCSGPTPGPLTAWRVELHSVGPNWALIDATPLVGPDADYCESAGWTDHRRYCPPRPEGTPEPIVRACLDLVVGPRPAWPSWSGEGFEPTDNPYQVRFRPQGRAVVDVAGSNGAFSSMACTAAGCVPL